MVRYQIDLDLFGLAEAQQHLVQADPQLQYAMGLFPEATRLLELSQTVGDAQVSLVP
jgi:hypothetical protein